MSGLPDIFIGEPIWGFSESADAENWQGGMTSREEAEAACRDEYGSGYVCEGRWIAPGKVAALAIDAERLLEQMDEMDYICGSFDETVFPVPNMEAAQGELQLLVAAWAERHVKGRHWLCTGEPIKVDAFA